MVPTQEAEERPLVQVMQTMEETGRLSLGKAEAEVQAEGGKNEGGNVSGF
jgi:hypothetical protein